MEGGEIKRGFIRSKDRESLARFGVRLYFKFKSNDIANQGARVPRQAWRTPGKSCLEKGTAAPHLPLAGLASWFNLSPCLDSLTATVFCSP